MSSTILTIYIALYLFQAILAFEEIRDLNFDPIYGSLDVDADLVRIVLDPKLNLSLGFSICLRVNFKILNKKCLFKADENLQLSLEDYQTGGGELTFKKSSLTLKKIWMNWSTFLHLFVQLLKYSIKY
jgi:hypothetical protein